MLFYFVVKKKCRSCLRSVVFFIIFITCITGYVLSFEAGGNGFKTRFFFVPLVKEAR